MIDRGSIRFIKTIYFFVFHHFTSYNYIMYISLNYKYKQLFT